MLDIEDAKVKLEEISAKYAIFLEEPRIRELVEILDWVDVKFPLENVSVESQNEDQIWAYISTAAEQDMEQIMLLLQYSTDLSHSFAAPYDGMPPLTYPAKTLWRETFLAPFDDGNSPGIRDELAFILTKWVVPSSIEILGVPLKLELTLEDILLAKQKQNNAKKGGKLIEKETATFPRPLPPSPGGRKAPENVTTPKVRFANNFAQDELSLHETSLEESSLSDGSPSLNSLPEKVERLLAEFGRKDENVDEMRRALGKLKGDKSAEIQEISEVTTLKSSREQEKREKKEESTENYREMEKEQSLSIEDAIFRKVDAFLAPLAIENLDHLVENNNNNNNNNNSNGERIPKLELGEQSPDLPRESPKVSKRVHNREILRRRVKMTGKVDLPLLKLPAKMKDSRNQRSTVAVFVEQCVGTGYTY